jgi:cytochrome c553
MRATFGRVAFLVVSVASLAWGAQTPQATPTAEQVAFFESKIRPVLAENCFGCHGKDVQMAGLRLDTREGALKVISPGSPNKSLLITAVHQSGPLKMPKGKKLKANEIADLEAWVAMGAPWPAKEMVRASTLWSLQPVRMPAIPVLKDAKWARNKIDVFVLAQLEAKGMKPAVEADRRTLIRRLSYDLTGLPPSAAQVAAFVQDKNPLAYENLVDRLLASPQYGERWGRLWLDVARYADTKGYVFEEDRNYPNAYTYRDWVIKAFNRDLPYDKFIVEQLAADAVTTGEEKTDLAALGFLTVGRRFLNNAPDIIDDRIDVTMRGFQGFTVACARCHDHKFDPIPTQDYYSLYGVFASSEERTEPISPKEIRNPWIVHNYNLGQKEAEVRDLILSETKRLRGDASAAPEIKQALQMLREGQLPEGERLKKLLTAFKPEERDRLKYLEAEAAELRRTMPTVPEFAMAMFDRANPGDGVIFKRGNPGMPGDPAPRRFLAALSKGERTHWTKGSGRLDLARAIASRENPLTARVFVNRVWQGHFGEGIVRTPSDFGTKGEKPTNPQLLDFLAATFMENGWSVKRLHRMIVNSATYRQSSTVDRAAYNRDPDNRLLGRMNRRRLDMEQMRDTFMLAAGRLDLSKVGGKSVDLWGKPFTHRRAVYGFVERQNLPGTFRTFDFATPDSTSARRFQTTVPQQALFFLNSPFAVENAQALAARAEVKAATSPAAQVRALYRLVYQRSPDADELSAGEAFLLKGTGGKLSRLEMYAQALLLTDELMFVD